MSVNQKAVGRNLLCRRTDRSVSGYSRNGFIIAGSYLKHWMLFSPGGDVALVSRHEEEILLLK